MQHRSISNPRLDAIRTRLAVIAVEQAALVTEHDALLVEMGRLEGEATMALDDPYIVNAQWLIAKLTMSPSAFWRLVRNDGKGFPQAVHPDSDPKWKWGEVKEWLERTR